MKNSQKLTIPFHPLLIAIYPVLALYLNNVEETPLFAISRSLIFSLLVMLGIHALFLLMFMRWNVIVRSKKLPALLGLGIIFTALYPLFYNLIRNNNLASISIGQHRYLIPLWGALYVAVLQITLGLKNLSRYFKTIFVWEKASVATSLFLILFFLYGHVFNQFLYDPSRGSKFLFSQHQTLYAVTLSVFLSGIGFVVFSKRSHNLIKWLNITSAILVGMTVVQLVYYFVKLPSLGGSRLAATTSSITAETPSLAARDIYYIVLDAYSREDVLRDDLNLDTSEFIGELEDMGFVIPSCSNSNYQVTHMSMVTTLNMDYLENLNIPESKKDCVLERCLKPGDLSPQLKHSLVRQKLEDLGYSTVTFKVVNPYLDITDSTYYYDYSADASSIDKTETVFFFYLFLQTTALRPYLDYLARYPNALPSSLQWLPVGSAFTDRNYNQYKLSLYNLEALANAPDLPGPLFVYAHLVITHEPFVFTPEGEFRYPVTGDPAAYRDQVLFANNRMTKIVRAIIEKSEIQPIIILQSDHGWPWGPTRTHNFSAFYLPENGGQLIYPEITNVNTFRIVFNEYFGESFSLLPDISFRANSKADTNLFATPSTCSE